jgi:hypothetical protein
VKTARAETERPLLVGRPAAVEKRPERSGTAMRPNESDGMAMVGMCQVPVVVCVRVECEGGDLSSPAPGRTPV